MTSSAIADGIRANEDLIGRFAQAWYASPYTYQSTKVLGHQACKIPFDLWVFHDLFCQYRFETVVETGTADGGTTLWFATLMDLLGIDGHVFSIDIAERPGRPVHDRITYLTGNSTDRDFADLVAGRMTGPVLVDLDSGHGAAHVLNELWTWAPLVPVGSWLVVEDTNGSPHGEDGPLAAVLAYQQSHYGEFLREMACERYWLTMNPGGWMQRVSECRHG